MIGPNHERVAHHDGYCCDLYLWPWKNETGSGYNWEWQDQHGKDLAGGNAPTREEALERAMSVWKNSSKSVRVLA